MNTTRIRQALDQARTIIVAKIEGIEEDCCLADKKTGKPLLETMDHLAMPDHYRCLRAVKLIDEALKEIEA